MRTVSLTAFVMAASVATAFAQDPQAGLRYWALEDRASGEIIQRGTAGGNGNVFTNMVLPPRSELRLWVVSAETLRVGYATVRTGRAGSRTRIPTIALSPPNVHDTDDDGLPDLIETVVGTNGHRADTDGDGVPDGGEVRQGTNPLDGLPARTGLVGTVDTEGTAQDVCASEDSVAIADGLGGVRLFNVFNRMSPRAIASVSVGVASQVACGTGLLAAIADGDVVLVDVRDPPAARIGNRITATTLRGVASAVAIVDGVVYVGTLSGDLVTIDAATGTVLERAPVGGAVVDMTVEGLDLLLITPRRLATVRLDAASLEVAGSVEADPAITTNQRLFVGGGVAYVVSAGGYQTFDVTVPATPTAIAAHRPGQLGWRELAVNGAGVGVAVVSPNRALSVRHNLDVLDVSDPAAGPAVETTHATPGAAHAVALYNGLAYVADGNRGLSVVNYRAADTGETPPTVALGGSIDFTATPVRIEEGKLIVIRADVNDDVEVRNVEFYVNSARVATDGAFPYEHQLTTPTLAERPTITVSARAWDTGGNSTFTEPVVVELTVDATPPMVRRVAPPRRRAHRARRRDRRLLHRAPQPAVAGPRELHLVRGGAGPDGWQR